MSIHPRYARAILDGRKTVELRKRPLAPDIQLVVIYATAPTSAVVGAFIVDRQTTDEPESLWGHVGAEACIAKDAFDAYYADHARGTGIHVADVLAAPTPVPLDELGVGRPPQSFQYLSSDAVAPFLCHLQDA